MAELKLLYKYPSDTMYGSAWIVLEGNYSPDENGFIALTPDCATLDELSYHIDNFKHDLERAENQAKDAFAEARTKPPRDPFSV